MMTWTEFSRCQPVLADAGRAQLYQVGIGLGFLATVRPDGGPRVHPVCPVVSAAGLHVLIVAGPKQADLRRDGRYALHSETCPPPREEDGFAVIGRAAEVRDPAVRAVVREQILTERDGKIWPSFDTDALFELHIERCLLMLTDSDGTFPQGPTIWRAQGRSYRGGPIAEPGTELSFSARRIRGEFGVKRRIVVVLAVLAVTSCSQSGHHAAPRPTAPRSSVQNSTTPGGPDNSRPASQLSVEAARQVFDGFLTAFEKLERTHSSAAASKLMTGPEKAAQNLKPGTVTGPELAELGDERFFVPSLSSYPRWFTVTGREQFTDGGAAHYLFLLIQAGPGLPWQDATELWDTGQSSLGLLPDLSGVAADANGLATTVPPGDTSLAVAPGALPARFSRYFDAAVTHQGAARPGFTNFIVPLTQQAERLAPRYGWRVLDDVQPVNSPLYSLRLVNGGAAVVYLTRETFTWQAASASAALSTPSSAYGIGATPDPSILKRLHVTSVRPGLRITLTVVDEHLAIDPGGSGTVTDYFNGKTTAETLSG